MLLLEGCEIEVRITSFFLSFFFIFLKYYTLLNSRVANLSSPADNKDGKKHESLK